MRSSVRVKILLFIFTVGILVLLFPHGESLDANVSVGSIWTKEDLIAPMSFEILKDPTQYEKEKAAAAAKVYPVFIVDDSVSSKSLKAFSNFWSTLKRQIRIYKDSLTLPSNLSISQKDFEKLLDLKRSQILLSNSATIKLNDISRSITNSLLPIYKAGITDITFEDIKRDTVSVLNGRIQKSVPISKLYDMKKATAVLLNNIQSELVGDISVDSLAYRIALRFLSPNLIYSETQTNREREIAMSKVSRNIGIVNENERIVAKHDRITKEIKLKIDSYKIARGEQISSIDLVMQYVGKTIHVVVVLFLFMLYLFLSRKKIYNDNLNLLMIAIIILFTSSLAYFVQLMNVNTPVNFLVLVPMGSMLLAILFDSRVAFFGTVAIAFIVGGILGNDYIQTLTHMIAGGLAAYTVSDVKNRNQIFRSFFFILIGYLLGIFAFGFERFHSLQNILLESSFAATNALLSPVLTFAFIYFFEKIFHVSTDLTYLELSDTNNTLLRELMSKAPGTFNHSMVIGNMVEEAATKIDANALLARVGAYYHDIGKTYYPEAFVENQFNDVNIHDKLPPEESVKIIMGHVSKGIELAEDFGLPSEIVDFIPMHHGTLVVGFFYDKAKQLYGEDKVNEEDYRYKGPKPNTKETALLMLADACESAVRAMNEVEPQKVENLVSNLIEYRMRDGQLDDSNLTFKDIRLIKESFVNVLLNQHHKRIRYPNQDEIENHDSASDGE
jgi:putative nucleotidyltransferase with HDIG domain